jgi:hypothetical protein
LRGQPLVEARRQQVPDGRIFVDPSAQLNEQLLGLLVPWRLLGAFKPALEPVLQVLDPLTG